MDKMPPTPQQLRNAIFSEDKTRRYLLTRTFGSEELKGTVAFVMLNPSIADDKQDDPAIRKCIGFGKRWGFSEIIIVNLLPIISTNPYALPPWHGRFMDNEPYLRHAVNECDLVTVAWGSVSGALSRTIAFAEHLLHFREISDGTPLHCIGLTAVGAPLHPSRAPYTDAPLPWAWRT